MFPLSLTLKGFRGIRDGLGRDVLTLDFERLCGDAELVALVGANGRGKTTILDNLHPYLTMPSRAATGPGGFSYYDHVCLPENEKDLIWQHAGQRYRSQVVIRSNGRKSTEAYLFALDEAGAWRPVQLPDGTVSDGKTRTYTCCVEHLLGSADTFFTSVFSAQGKRQLSAYQNAEIKELLADLLGQEEIRTLGKKAGEAAGLIKMGLAATRQEHLVMEEQAQRLEAERQKLAAVAGQTAARMTARQHAQQTLETARTEWAQQRAAFDQSRSIEAQRTRLDTERAEIARRNDQAMKAVGEQERGQRQRLGLLNGRITTRQSQAAARRQALAKQKQQCDGVLVGEWAAGYAVRRQACAETVLAARSVRVRAAREQVEALGRCSTALDLARQRMQAIAREAGQAVLRVEDLARRLGLTHEVPCAGSDLQGQCKLLGEARQAQALMPSAQGTIKRLSDDKTATQQELVTLTAQRHRLDAAPQALLQAEVRETWARNRTVRFARLAAKAGEICQARRRLGEIEQERAALDEHEAITETEEERAERLDIEAALQAITAQRTQQASHYQQALDRLDTALSALPLPFDHSALTEAERSLANAQATAAEAESGYIQSVQDAEKLAALDRQANTLACRQKAIAVQIKKVEGELGSWNLLTKCLSNNGLIALAIDDAGPTLAGLANDLLLSCYGPRFTVSLLTQIETGKGEHREGFDILVHDGESGQSKRVEQMSGGERVWINESLVRAVALYLAQHTGRHYETLYSDEADGALDAARKRMFMAMKREVLRLGGYAREIYISQAQELTAMADVVIDLADYRAGVCVTSE
jgi:exonuclease SbcC